MQELTESMLATNAAERMREQPGCRSVSAVEIIRTPEDRRLGMITHGGATDSDIVRGRIAVERALKQAYTLKK